MPPSICKGGTNPLAPPCSPFSTLALVGFGFAGFEDFHWEAFGVVEEVVGGLVQHAEGGVVDGDDVLEVEELAGGVGGGGGVHGVVAADGEQADGGVVEFIDDGHVAVDGGMARVIDRVVGRGDDEAGGVAEVGAVFRCRGVPGGDEGDGVVGAEVDGAAVVGVDGFFDAVLFAEPGGEFHHGEDGGTGFGCYRDGV